MLTIRLDREWLSRRLGDAAVLGVLTVAYLLSGCGGSDGNQRGTKVAEAQPAPAPATVTPGPASTTPTTEHSSG